MKQMLVVAASLFMFASCGHMNKSSNHEHHNHAHKCECSEGKECACAKEGKQCDCGKKTEESAKNTDKKGTCPDCKS